MKKKLLVLCALQFCFFHISHSQEIKDVIIEQNGIKIRAIEIPSLEISDNNPKYFPKVNIGLRLFVENYQKNNQKKNFEIYLYAASLNRICIQENARVLIKLNNDKIITLRNKSKSEDLIGRLVHSMTIYVIHASYGVVEGTINEIINTGVKKIRIEMFDDYFEKEDNLSISDHFNDSMKKIKSKLTTKDTFIEGF